MPDPPGNETPRTEGGRVLLVDDDDGVRRAYSRCLTSKGFLVDEAEDGVQALERLAAGRYDAIISDIQMPNLDGLALLEAVRKRDLDVPIILMTGQPSVQSAARAVEYGALQYLMKPIGAAELGTAVTRAVRLHQMALTKLEAADVTGSPGLRITDRIGLSVRLDSALESLWMALQPVVRAKDGSVYGYEALLRSKEPTLPHPEAVLEAAERLGRLDDVGRVTRARAAEAVAGNEEVTVFVNLHPRDLADSALIDPKSPLTRIAKRVILEITERASLDPSEALKARILELRNLGYRIAIDDLGAGYSGLSSFALLEPDIVKLDLSLIRDVHTSRTKQRLIRSMTSLARDLGILTVAEGIERTEERDQLVALGCDLLQGYLFALPGPPFPKVTW